MGMYTGLRFKGTIKPEYRDIFQEIATQGNWSILMNNTDFLSNEAFITFTTDSRCSFIPCGSLCYMPECWECEPYDKFYNGKPTDGFDGSYDKTTGKWSFQCSLKNYDLTIEKFLVVAPFICESVEHCEYYYESNDFSSFYELKDNKMIFTSDTYRRYRLDGDIV